MKSDRTYSYTNDIMGFPSLFVALGWFSLFLLWPRIEYSPTDKGHPSVPAIIFTETTGRVESMDPPLRLDPQPNESESIEKFSARKLIDYKPTRDHSLPPVSAEDIAQPEKKYSINLNELTRYKTDFDIKDRSTITFRDIKVKNSIVVETSGSLKTHNFTMPDLNDISGKSTLNNWLVKLYVETDSNGNPVHVFLETPADDDEINSAVIRAVHRGHIAGKAQKCRGMIIISYCRIDQTVSQ